MIERHKIEDHLRLHPLRKKDITASVVSVLFGASEYQTPLGLYHIKNGDVEEENDEPLISDDEISLSPMGRGLLMEDPAEKMLRLLKPDWEVEKNKFYYRDPELRVGATPDLIVRDPKRGLGVVQVKNPEASIYRTWVQEDGSIEPPVDYAIQNILEAYLTGAEWAAVGAFVVSHRTTFKLIPVDIHPGILARIRYEVADFWKRIEEHRPYPADYAKDGALIAQLYPKDNGIEIDLSADNELPGYVEMLEQGREKEKFGAADAKIAKTAIAAKMGEASFARLADGRRISFKTQRRAGYVVEDGTTRPIRILKGR
jgi:hypothetical protein